MPSSGSRARSRLICATPGNGPLRQGGSLPPGFAGDLETSARPCPAWPVRRNPASPAPDDRPDRGTAAPHPPRRGKDHQKGTQPQSQARTRRLNDKLRTFVAARARGAPRRKDAIPGRMAVVTGQSSSPDAPPGLSVLEAVVERITYANEDTGYTVARVATERTGPDLLTVVGPLLGAQVGESLRLTGRWGSHPRYGRQFQVRSYATVLPATIQGIRRYLGSGLIRGIGPVMAERMVAHFGTEILTVIEHQPGRLAEVHGLGPKRTKMIADAWEEEKAIKDVMVFLSGVGVSTSLAVRIYKKYAGTCIAVVRDEPFRLASEVWGIGFKTADTIAQAVGIARQPAANPSGAGLHLVPGRRQRRALLPARAEPDPRGGQDPRCRLRADRPLSG